MIAGTVGGVFARGGSVLVVPLLTTVFKFSQFRAQALGLTMVVPGIIVALITYAAHGQVAFFSGLPLAVGSLFLVPYGVDRKSTRLNSSHVAISYAVFCLKKKR